MIGGKPVVYQVFTRLFGNAVTTNEPWGTVERNGVGKFDDFTDTALAAIADMGVTHIWYTGVLHHAVIRDYSAIGVDPDDPDVVKGRAGSPYAVKDYYNVNPDLAVVPAERLAEFEALIERTHEQGMKVIIDIVPNHVARGYRSTSAPDGVEDFGADDDDSVEYSRDNNFYYVVGESFRVPEWPSGYEPLGGEDHPLADGRFDESPARWTGNGARAAQPHFSDWYETVKINHGVRPDGSYDFDRLPADYADRDSAAHAAFWRERDVPDSWKKFRDIALYWLDKGVDGFRYDMAEMVPVEFWSYLNSAVKERNSDAFLLAEVYNPALYRDYLALGLMDYLYDKVGFYDTLKDVMQGKRDAGELLDAQAEVADIEQHMLHFLENHDELRIASPDFAGNAEAGRPAMAVATAIGRSPTLLYFGQHAGEEGAGDPGFGEPSRTTIFDYWGVPAHQRWMNGGAFDGGQLTDPERRLHVFYRRLLVFSSSSLALTGDYAPVHAENLAATEGYDERLLSFVRWRDAEQLIVAANFDDGARRRLDLLIPEHIIAAWELEDGDYYFEDALSARGSGTLAVRDGRGLIAIRLAPLEAVILSRQ
ncbi:MAG: alpha-amylase family protein [Pseudomonadota bacterium]